MVVTFYLQPAGSFDNFTKLLWCCKLRWIQLHLSLITHEILYSLILQFLDWTPAKTKCMTVICTENPASFDKLLLFAREGWELHKCQEWKKKRLWAYCLLCLLNKYIVFNPEVLWRGDGHGWRQDYYSTIINRHMCMLTFSSLLFFWELDITA